MAKRRKRGKTVNVNYEYYRLFYYVCKYHSITPRGQCAAHEPAQCDPRPEPAGGTAGLQAAGAQHPRRDDERRRARCCLPTWKSARAAAGGGKRAAGITALEKRRADLSASETALNVFLLDKLREFHRRYPGVRLRIANPSTRRPSVRWDAGWWIFV